ncbi:class I SAM-dependent methyltransferase [Acidipila sp. EB88]|uniref:class I SAM-dependent methyltransferase n=1 Tax=Acidipila sp. EB88 TaxID=2305226 RepID=UPI000F5E3EEC|nr:class I SAM-dependent methyltransferase [Acidipila sp. EB88]
MADREDYGIDAPRVVRNLGIIGGAFLVGGVLPRGVPGSAVLHMFWPSGLSLLAACAWMLASSLWLKKGVMRSLVGERRWRGDEMVLDVGCGRGLVSVEAARRVPHGSVHGVDIWQAEDLSGNGPEAILINAAAAGVSDRLTIDTGDARKLPYPDALFEVVLSMTTIHNIPDAAGRRQAISEAWRVLRPGGQILIFDIRHARTYLRQLRDEGATEITLKGPILLWGPVGWRFSAVKPSNSGSLITSPVDTV